MNGLETLLANATLQRVGWALLHFLWQGAGAAVLLAGAMWFLRRRSANVKYAVACSGLAFMLVLPAATIWLVNPSPTKQTITMQNLHFSTKKPSCNAHKTPKKCVFFLENT